MDSRQKWKDKICNFHGPYQNKSLKQYWTTYPLIQCVDYLNDSIFWALPTSHIFSSHVMLMAVVFYRATLHIVEALGIFSRPRAWDAMSFTFSSKLLLLSSVYLTYNKLHFPTGMSRKLLEHWIKSTGVRSLSVAIFHKELLTPSI